MNKFRYVGQIIQPDSLDKEANKIRSRKMDLVLSVNVSTQKNQTR